MKNLNRVLFFVLAIEVSLLFLQSAHAFFSDTGVSSSNTFSAALSFGTPTPSITETPTPTPTPENIATHPVISEVQLSVSGAQGTNKDFIELYNPTSSPFDLNGYRLVSRTGSSSNDDTIIAWTSSAIIPAHGFYLWASSDDGYSTSISANAASTENIGPSQSIALRLGDEDTGTIIDALSWNESVESLKEGTEFSPNPGDDQSMERKAYTSSTVSSMISGADIDNGNGYDTNNNSTNFVLRTTSQPQNTISASETP